jgi:hypothetical protein
VQWHTSRHGAAGVKGLADLFTLRVDRGGGCSSVRIALVHPSACISAKASLSSSVCLETFVQLENMRYRHEEL